MLTDYIPASDKSFNMWLAHFLAVAQANRDALGLSAAELQTLAHQQPLFARALQTVFQQKKTLAASVQAKTELRDSTTAAARAVVGKIQANPSVPDTLIAQMGMTVRRTRPAPAPPVAPLHLQAQGFDNGVNFLKWNRNGNPPRTFFEIEARVGGSAEWRLLQVVTACKYTHTGHVPGVPIAYRVRARRGKLTSPLCITQPTLYASGTVGYNS